MPKQRQVTTRRGFLGAAAAFAAPLFVKSTAFGANDQFAMGFVGMGGQGRGDMGGFLGFTKELRALAVCDVDVGHREKARNMVNSRYGNTDCDCVNDFRDVTERKDIDAVFCATPDHWHAPVTVSALKNGKDVYCEKPETLTIREGRVMIETARRYGRVFSGGSQRVWQDYNWYHRVMWGGAAGKLQEVYVNIGGPSGDCYLPAQPVPAGLDWDGWLGPAPEVPYNSRLHRQWYGYWRFSGGNGSDAIHTLDAARMVIGDPPHPKSVQCVGGRWKFEEDDGVMPDVQIVAYEFDKMAMSFECTGFTEKYMFKTPMGIRQSYQLPFWPLNTSRIEIYGTERMMYLGRVGGGWQVLEAGPPDMKEALADGFGNVVAQGYGRFPDEPHAANFIDCIRTREMPNADIEQGHMAACLEHMANLSYRLGNAKLAFDGASETFVGNDEANGHLKPSYRKHYRVPDEV